MSAELILDGRLIPGLGGRDSTVPGPPGPAGPTYLTLEKFKAAPITNKKQTLAAPGIAFGEFFWEDSNPPYVADDISVIQADGVSLSTGAWIRAGLDSLSFRFPSNDSVLLDPAFAILIHGVTPEMFGAIGDGIADDTFAMQKAFDKGGNVHLGFNKKYKITSRLRIWKDYTTVSGGGHIIVPLGWNFAADTSGTNQHLRVIFVEAAHVKFHNLVMEFIGYTFETAGNAVENCFIWSTGPHTTVTSCICIGNPKGTFLFGLSAWVNFQDNYVVNCSGAVFARGRAPIASNNIIINATDAAIAFNGQSCVGGVVSDNTISNEQGAVIPGMIAMEEGASEWTITSNTMIGANATAIWCGNVLLEIAIRGGVIANNVIKAGAYTDARLTSPAPGALIFVSPFYLHSRISGNSTHGYSGGNANTCIIKVAANGTIVENNTFDAVEDSGIVAIMQIDPGLPDHSHGIVVRNNKSMSGPGVRHILFNAGDFKGKVCLFEGGHFIGGQESINTMLNAAGIAGLENFEIHNISEITEGLAMNCENIIGDRNYFMNTGAAELPHWIGKRTEMYCTLKPANGGAKGFVNGDRFKPIDVATLGCMAFVKVAGGTPFVPWGEKYVAPAPAPAPAA